MARYIDILGYYWSSTISEVKNVHFEMDTSEQWTCRWCFSILIYSKVLPVLLSRLPLEEDHDEDAVVYSALLNVFRREDVLADEKLAGDIFQVLVKVLRDEKVTQGSCREFHVLSLRN